MIFGSYIARACRKLSLVRHFFNYLEKMTVPHNYGTGYISVNTRTVFACNFVYYATTGL